MAVLPTGVESLSQGIQFAQQPSRTWWVDQETRRIQGEIDGYQAAKQAVEVILNVQRFRWQIYTPYTGMQWDGLIGQDPGYVASELQRRIRDALSTDSRMRGISDFSYSVAGSTLSASLTVDTVYGDIQTSVEVNLN